MYFLLTWSPKKSQGDFAPNSWPNLPDMAAQTRPPANRLSDVHRHSCGSNRSIKKGDRVFLLKQGQEPKGIIGSATVVSEGVFEEPHWVPEQRALGKKARYINLQFDRLLDPALEKPLPVAAGTPASEVDVNWNTQSSGIRISDEEAQKLEQIWAEHLSSPNLGWLSGEEIEPQTSTRNPPWIRDELILALDLYFRHPPNSISETHPEVIKLSDTLNHLPIQPNRPDSTPFRNPKGVYQKLCNFLRFDPNYNGEGGNAGNRIEKEVWDAFADDRGSLKRVVNAILEERNQDQSISLEIDEDADHPEGRILYRTHKAFERNPEVIRKAKILYRRQRGKLDCQVCGFDFEATYGELGRDFIEGHHTKPFCELSGERKSRASDIALVCSNCHRMLHRQKSTLSLNALKSILNQH